MCVVFVSLCGGVNKKDEGDETTGKTTKTALIYVI